MALIIALASRSWSSRRRVVREEAAARREERSRETVDLFRNLSRSARRVGDVEKDNVIIPLVHAARRKSARVRLS